MIQIIFKKQIHSCFASMSSNDVYLHRVVHLPFVPHVGMEVIEGDEWSDTVKSLCVKDGLLFAITDSDKELYEAGFNRMTGNGATKPRSIDEIVSEYVSDGWAVSEGFLSE